MEPRLSLVTLGVSDLDRACDFYLRVLGWEPAHRLPSIAFFDLGGLAFALYPHADLAADMKAQATPLADYHGFTLAHNLRSEAEVDATFVRLREAGATIVKPPEKVFWGGYSGYFADADGHRWEVAYNPHWTVREDGRITMSTG